VRAVALLGSRQAEGEVAALYSRASVSLKRRVLDVAVATGERLFRSTIETAGREPEAEFRDAALRFGRWS
jgi:hypothetical protein